MTCQSAEAAFIRVADTAGTGAHTTYGEDVGPFNLAYILIFRHNINALMLRSKMLLRGFGGSSLMDFSIVDADKADVEKLIQIYSSPELYHTVEDASWFVRCFFDYHHIKVAKLKGDIVGALFWRVNEEKHDGIVVIEDFWVDEKQRRRGIGERLLRSSIEDAMKLYESSGYTLRKVLVTTGEDNVPARRLYEKVGFKKGAELKDLFKEGETELIYILSLNP